MAGVLRGLLSIPVFKQVGDGIAEARQHVLHFQEGARAQQLSLRERGADFSGLGLGIHNPGVPPCDPLGTEVDPARGRA